MRVRVLQELVLRAQKEVVAEDHLKTMRSLRSKHGP